MDLEVFTTACCPDTQHVVLEKGYRKVGFHQDHLLSVSKLMLERETTCSAA